MTRVPVRVGLWLLAGFAACDSDGKNDGGGSGSAGETGETGETSSGAEAGDTDASGGTTGVSDTSGGTSDGSGGEAGSEGTDSGSTGATAEMCELPTLCDAAPPNVGQPLGWDHTSSNFEAIGGARHRIRDMFYVGDEPQWVLGKFAYGPTDEDIEDERVDLYVLRNCEGSWESLGSILTTDDDEHPAVEGVEDDGGRVFFQIPEELRLEPGRHRIHAIMRGDNSRTDGFIEVLEPGSAIFVSDVDGTLTTSETEEWGDLLTGSTPNVRESAPDALGLLAERGYRPMYITARPDWLTERTRQFVLERGLPLGIIHTSTSELPQVGGGASGFKTAELERLQEKGLDIVYAFGNTETDAAAYDAAGIEPVSNRIFMQFEDTAHGGRTIMSYAELLGEFEALESICE